MSQSSYAADGEVSVTISENHLELPIVKESVDLGANGISNLRKNDPEPILQTARVGNEKT